MTEVGKKSRNFGHRSSHNPKCVVEEVCETVPKSHKRFSDGVYAPLKRNKGLPPVFRQWSVVNTILSYSGQVWAG